MPIPIHQVHNVLTAYARRLHNRRSAGYDQTTSKTEDFGERRRTLIERMTIHYIDKTIDQHARQKHCQPIPLRRQPISEDQLIYHELDADCKKIQRCLSRRE